MQRHQLKSNEVLLRLNGKLIDSLSFFDNNNCAECASLDVRLLRRDGRDSMVDVVRALAVERCDPSIIDRKFIGDRLHTSAYTSEVDLLLHCAHARSLGGFPPWAMRAAELVRIVHRRGEPISERHFIDALQQYAQRDRRFGK